MRKSKKFISVMMAMTMAAVMAVPAQVIGIGPGTGTVFAAEEEVENNAQGRCGDNALYKYDATTQTLTVSGTGAMWDDYGFAANLQDTKKIVIEKGITTIGAYSFGGLDYVKEISLAETVTTIKKCALPYVGGTVEIPASVTNVEKWGLGGAKRYIVKGDIKGYAISSIKSMSYDNEIILCGTAEDLGRALWDEEEYLPAAITIAEDNVKCKIGNGCILSADGKELYYCATEREEITVPDSVERIRTAAFDHKYIDTLVLGSNVKTIDDFAFSRSEIGKITMNNQLTTIGTKAFYDTELKNVTLKGQVKLGVAAFNEKVKIKYTKKFKTAQTTVARAEIGKSKFKIKFAKISGAKGYQIRVNKGKKTYKYTTTKNYYTKKAPKQLTKSYRVKKEYTMEGTSAKPEGAAYVTVRPYKKVKNKTTYGRWSVKTVLSYKK